MPNDFARLHALMTGQDGPAAPIADESTYSWPQSAGEATAERMARYSIAAGLHHQRQAVRFRNGDRWAADQTAAMTLCDRAVLLLALQRIDPDRADELARDLWETAENAGTEASLNYAARAMGIPLSSGVAP